MEDTNLGKYDHFRIDQEALKTVEKVELTPADVQAQAPEPNLVPIQAAAVNKLTIEQCRVLALQNNLTIKVDSFDPQMARESLKREHARFEPLFISGFDFSNRHDYLYLQNSNDYNLFNGFSVPLVTGGQVNAGYNIGQQSSYYDFGFDSIDKWTSYSTSPTVSISQPLLKGAGPEVNTYNIRLSSYSMQRTQARSKLSAMTVLVSVDKAFWRLYYAQEALKVLNVEYELARAQYELASRMSDNKQVGQIEVMRAKNAMAPINTAIIIAKSNLMLSQRALKLVLNSAGLEVESESEVVADIQPESVRYSLDRTKLLEYAMEHRLELLDYEIQLASQRDNIDYAKNSLLPSLALSYAYSGLNTGGQFDDAVTDRNSSSNRVGLDLAVPLGNRAAKSNMRRALLEQNQLAMEKQQKVELIKGEVLDATETLNSTWERIVSTRTGVEVARSTMDAEQLQFKQGTQTSTDLLRAQAEYSRALMNSLNAQVDYQVAQIDLCYQVGGLNQAARLQFD
ncbi:MAG: TolC family protein [Sedimentisphaerales bacterium]|nr:TolC family protein [Sedimentisphaerales bacterium]